MSEPNGVQPKLGSENSGAYPRNEQIKAQADASISSLIKPGMPYESTFKAAQVYVEQPKFYKLRFAVGACGILVGLAIVYFALKGIGGG